jgi:CYTH domain-containing protein
VANLKYAQVERERRWLLVAAPELPDQTRRLDIIDRYISGTRLRLRQVTENGSVTRKLGQKLRLGDAAGEIAHTSMYLDDAEWDVLASLPAAVVTKVRTLVSHVEGTVAVDVFGGHLAGLVLAEVDSGEGRSWELPKSYGILGEVTGDEAFTGGALAVAR